MGREIERRFLLKPNFHPQLISDDKIFIHQTYLMGTGDWVMRARMALSDKLDETEYTITLKQGVSKVESKEINIPTTLEGYEDFCSECLTPIRKSRYIIPHGDLKFEVDVFLDLLSAEPFIAEIELPSAKHSFELPDWLGEEITGKKGYSNFALFRKLHGIKKR